MDDDAQHVKYQTVHGDFDNYAKWRKSLKFQIARFPAHIDCFHPGEGDSLVCPQCLHPEPTSEPLRDVRVYTLGPVTAEG